MQGIPRTITLLLLTLAIAVGLFPDRPDGRTAAAPGRAFQVTPVPAWVVPVDVPEGQGDAHEVHDGIHDLLEDAQVRVTPGGAEYVYRRVYEVLTTAGLEEASQLQFEFDPSSETLAIHSIRIVRDGEPIDALRVSEINVVQLERELEDQIYTGLLAAVTFLRDVRPGDRIDLAFSIRRSADLFGGRFADLFAIGKAYPVRHIRWRLLWPDGRSLAYLPQHTDVQPQVRRIGGETEYLWERRDAQAAVALSGAPDWYDPTPTIQVSEFASWSEVVRWAQPFYPQQPKLSPELAREIERWSRSGATPADRALAATRFVQDEIRYTGIELGPSSYRPADPSVVLQRRYGDCKDKSLLLVTALQSMGIEAHPALADLDGGRALRGWQPSPLAFDHVIVRARIGEEVYWIDPTIALQRGDLVTHQNPPYGYALVIRDGSSELEEIQERSAEMPTIEVVQTFTIEALDGPVTMDVLTTYRRNAADDVRMELARVPLSEIAADGHDYYAQEYAAIEMEGMPRISDDEATNTLVVAERYRIGDFWDGGERALAADRIEERLATGRGARRSAPLSLAYPSDVRQVIEIRSPSPIAIADDELAIEGDAVSFTYRRTVGDGTLRAEYRLKTLRDSVAGDRIPAYRDAVRKMRRVTRIILSRSAFEAGGGSVWATGLSGAGLLAVAVWLGFRARRRTRKAAPAAGLPTVGASPRTPIEVAGHDALLKQVASLRCRCGGSYEPGEEVGLTYDGRGLVLHSLRCSTCGSARDLYVARPAARGAAG